MKKNGPMIWSFAQRAPHVNLKLQANKQRTPISELSWPVPFLWSHGFPKYYLAKPLKDLLDTVYNNLLSYTALIVLQTDYMELLTHECPSLPPPPRCACDVLKVSISSKRTSATMRAVRGLFTLA